MTLLSSLHSNLNAAVIGASGGIGRAFVELLAADTAVQNVYAFSRSPVHWPAGNFHDCHIDIIDEASIEDAAAIEQSRNPAESIVAALHPGTVETALSDPYTRRLD